MVVTGRKIPRLLIPRSARERARGDRRPLRSARQGPPRPAQPSPGFVTLCRNAAKNSASVKPSTSR